MKVNGKQISCNISERNVEVTQSVAINKKGDHVALSILLAPTLRFGAVLS